MKISERLIERLRQAGLGLPEGTRLVRVNPSQAMRNEGAWSWFAQGPDGAELRIGSQYPMGDLLKAEALEASSGAVNTDLDVTPARACRKCTHAAVTACRICRGSFCRPCLTDHHHEGYGTPADRA